MNGPNVNPLKNKSASQLRHQVASTRRISVSAFFNLRVLIGLFVFLAGIFLSALGGFGTFSSVFAENGTTREQMAVALAQALNVQIPACVPGQEMFNDVPASNPFCPFIEELARRGITGGCGGGNYCPNSAVTRAQMAAFLVKVNGSESHTTDTGEANTVTGIGALQSNTTGSFNTANGFRALLSNTIGDFNTANGAFALFSNAEGNVNTATGASALFSNTTGGANTATGDEALFSNTEGNNNTAIGEVALFSNTTGNNNTANGESALQSNTDGFNNTANGVAALQNNITGSQNTATGVGALNRNTAGVQNTANGSGALDRNTTGSGNIALGVATGGNVTTANRVICIGHPGANVDDSCFIGHIFGAQVGNTAQPVLIDSFGKLGTGVSSRRFKKEIKSMGSVSEAILALKPVTFQYKNDLQDAGPQFGLIAEEVAEVDPDLVVRDKGGKPYTVRYDAVNAMLLNEFLKEHKKVEELKSTAATQEATIAELRFALAKQKATIAQQQKDFRSAIAQQQKRMELLATKLEEQAAQIQKVSAQFQISRPALKTVLNNQ